MVQILEMMILMAVLCNMSLLVLLCLIMLIYIHILVHTPEKEKNIKSNVLLTHIRNQLAVLGTSLYKSRNQSMLNCVSAIATWTPFAWGLDVVVFQ